MTSLDKLAKMDGWDIGEDDTDAAIGESSAAATAGQQRSRSDGVGSRPETHTGGNHDCLGRDSRDLDREVKKKKLPSPSSPRNRPGQGGDFKDDGKASTSVTRATAGLESAGQERLQTIIADGEATSGNGGAASETLVSTDPAVGRTNTTRAGSAVDKIWDSPVRHPLDTLRKKGFGSECGETRGGGGTTGGTSAADEVNQLRASLKRGQEETAREKERREVCEEQARVAFASLEAETKRAVELDNRVRVAEMAMSISISGFKINGTRGGGRTDRGGALDDDGGTSAGGVSSKINNWERRARSLSPARKETTAADKAGMAETQAQMAVLADATNVAREEAQSALDTVEGFAKLNRKLVNELRSAINARDDLLKDLSIERGTREQLEEDIGELLESGFVTDMTRKHEELEARCAREREETARVAAAHARMEEEYRLALGSADQERARLEETIASLEAQLADERRAQAARAKEEAERAAMGSEEVLSVRAGLHPRAKRRGQDRVNLRQSSRNFSHGGRGGGSNGWPTAVQGGQRSAPSRGSPKHQKSTSHGGGVQPRNKRSDQQHQRSVSAIVTTVAGSRTGGYGGGIGGGGSSIGVGGMPGGDGSVGHAVHAAAVESVEVFLGDFVPKVAQPPAVATLLSACAEEKGAGGGGGGAAVKKLSKWAAIGRGGKISARATAVCIEEATKAAEAAAQNRLRSLTNASARALSVSWFSLLARATTTGGAAHGGDHGRDSFGNECAGTGSGGDGGAGSVDATVPVIAVRRLVQSCGILQGTAGGPTLAHADMELQRNAIGKGGRSIGHREFFKVILALAQYRFCDEQKDEALEKLSRMLRPTQLGPGAVSSHSQNRQINVATLAAKPAPGSAEATPGSRANAASPGGSGGEEDLAGAERVLERDRRALEAIFSNYCAGSLLPFAALAWFCKDFELTPGLISREDAHRIYVQLAYPTETLLTPKLLAAREGPQGRRAAAAARSGADGAGFGLTLGQWMTWLGLAAVGCTWFDNQRQQQGLYDTPTKKVLGLLQWMEGSVGKKRIGSKRGAAIVPAFHLLPLK